MEPGEGNGLSKSPRIVETDSILEIEAPGGGMQRPRWIKLSAGLLIAAALCAAQAPSKTEPTAPAPPAANAQTASGQPAAAHALEPPDLEAFFDGIFPLQLERSDVAGASVLVMRDGNVLLAKGYGFADLKAKKPVDPATTIFRLASISKLFTWTSVMQLQEQGKLDLDTDVNRYLDFQIEPAFSKPVTLRNLMTHTGGFEEMLNNLIVVDAKNPLSLRDDLIANQPRRIFPPGEIPAYSNYGVGLAGYIVQRLSGQPYEQYVHDHIFAPLGMTHSSFHQPPEGPLAALPSQGYRSDTTKPPVGFETVNPAPAGALSSTAADMGRFGQALLNGGELDGARILNPDTLALMWTPQYRSSDQMPAICMGFYQDWRNHLRWIGHEGDLIAFHSLFFVEPQQKLVLFVSYNSAGGASRPRPEIVNLFSDRYFPADMKQEFLKTPLSELKAIDGRYHSTRRPDSTRLKLAGIGEQSLAEVDKDGVLHLGSFKDLREHPVRWRPVGKDLWEEEDGQARLFAIRDSANRVVRIATDFPGVQLERVPWYEDDAFVLETLGASLAILALVVAASVLRVGRRIFFRRRGPLEPQPGTLWLTAGPRLAAFAWVAIAIGLAAWQSSTQGDLFPFDANLFRMFAVMNWATGVAIFLSIFAVVAGIRVWWRGQIRWITKVKFSLVALACLFACWFAVHWNMIGPAHRI
jgi:CubicO group peptidase (beta-lactamase class C family)